MSLQKFDRGCFVGAGELASIKCLLKGGYGVMGTDFISQVNWAVVRYAQSIPVDKDRELPSDEDWTRPTEIVVGAPSRLSEKRALLEEVESS